MLKSSLDDTEIKFYRLLILIFSSFISFTLCSKTFQHIPPFTFNVSYQLIYSINFPINFLQINISVASIKRTFYDYTFGNIKSKFEN